MIALRLADRRAAWIAALLIAAPSLAGDAIFGKVVEVKSGDALILDYGPGRYNVRIAGIAPQKGAEAARSKEFVSKMLLEKNAQLRFEGRNKAGEMIGRVLVEEQEKVVKDVGLELVRAGLARRLKNYDYKYRELSAAENEARKARRGVWSGGK